MWFAGLRGAIAFALAQNMPGKNKEVFITTTLFVVRRHVATQRAESSGSGSACECAGVRDSA